LWKKFGNLGKGGKGRKIAWQLGVGRGGRRESIWKGVGVPRVENAFKSGPVCGKNYGSKQKAREGVGRSPMKRRDEK